MTEQDMSPGGLLLAAAIQELPAIIDALRNLFAKDHPDTPAPTDAEVLAAFNAAYALSLAKDDAWLAAHPAPPVRLGADDPGSDR
jgi:hypothetical protein